MPFGLCNAPATFQALMNQVFEPFLRKFILVFFDDILVYSPSWEIHKENLKTTLDTLRKHELYAKRSKCSFGQEQIEYLWHIISGNGVSTNPIKIESMVNWPKPSNIKSLRGFLGLTGYYRKFVKGYEMISKPLTRLLKKDTFVWNEEATKAFEALKRAMTTTPVLVLPDFTKTFIVETDASGFGMGAVLMQGGRPIAYLSKAFGPKNMGLSIYEKEFMAMLLAINKWKHYLQGNHFIIKSDQLSLKHLLDQKLSTTLQQKWISKLLGFDYEVLYKKGIENKVADALSRKGEMEIEEYSCKEITLVQSLWINEVISSYEGDDKLQEFIASNVIDAQSYPDYTLKMGL